MLRPSCLGRCSTTRARQLLGEAVEDHPPRSGCVTSRPRNMIVTLTLSVRQEALDVALLGVVVVLRDLRAELDLADVICCWCLRAGFDLLRLLVLVLRVVEHPADRRLGVGRDLDEVEVPVLCVAQGVSVCMTPTCWPSSSISRTSGTRMRSLIRVVSRSGGCRSNLLGTGTSVWARGRQARRGSGTRYQRAEYRRGTPAAPSALARSATTRPTPARCSRRGRVARAALEPACARLAGATACATRRRRRSIVAGDRQASRRRPV